MTPTSIQTGRLLSYEVAQQTVIQGAADALIGADGNRVGIAAAISWAAGATTTDICVGICLRRNDDYVRLTTLTSGHPACWLDVAHLGPAFLEPLFVTSSGASNMVVSLTITRQIQELE
jgi:hypothetical protein